MVNEEADGYLLRVVFPQVFPCSYSLNVRAGSKGSSVKVIDGATAELIQNRLAPLDPMHEPHTVTGFASPSVSAVLQALDRLVKMHKDLAWEDALLCQDVFPGTGNVMKIECLHAFRLHPRSAVAAAEESLREQKMWCGSPTSPGGGTGTRCTTFRLRMKSGSQSSQSR